ncbi:MAG: hypothetical protein R3B52_00775 [Candidatus Paceibacterota bacterium]
MRWYVYTQSEKARNALAGALADGAHDTAVRPIEIGGKQVHVLDIPENAKSILWTLLERAKTDKELRFTVYQSSDGRIFRKAPNFFQSAGYKRRRIVSPLRRAS